MLASGMPNSPSLTTTAHEERTERSGMVGRSQRVPGTVATPSGEVKACLVDVASDRAVRLTTPIQT